MIEQRALKTLEFDKIRQQVAQYCTSSIGKSAIQELVPETDFEAVVALLEEMDEGLSILRVKGNVPMGAFLMFVHMLNVHKLAVCSHRWS